MRKQASAQEDSGKNIYVLLLGTISLEKTVYKADTALVSDSH